jgi:hypothetical protein
MGVDRRLAPLRRPTVPQNDLLALKWSDVNGEQSQFTIRSSKTEPHFRQSNMSLRTQLERLILQAGLKPWPKRFQNLRATRATELVGKQGAHIAANWLGHSQVIAKEHYWRPTAENIRRAVGGDGLGDVLGASVHANQSPSANHKRDDLPVNSRAESSPVVSGIRFEVTPRGLEPLLPP